MDFEVTLVFPEPPQVSIYEGRTEPPSRRQMGHTQPPQYAHRYVCLTVSLLLTLDPEPLPLG
jgi:hypothetical protein